MSVYNAEYNVLFIHIPKTAGTSMERREFLGGGGHQTIHEYDLDCFSFAFVRNPWDRFVSAFRHMFPQRDFRATCLRVPNDIHFKPQHKFICDDDGNILVDFVGRYENLKEDWKKVCDIVGVDDNLEHYRKGVGEYLWTPETRELIAQYYARDIEIFGYEEGLLKKIHY